MIKHIVSFSGGKDSTATLLIALENCPRDSVIPIFCDTGNARASAKKRGESQRGKGVVGYVKQDGRHQHRIVAEQMLGRLLVKGEIVHHKDGNKHNNSPENLEVMKQGEHMRAHGMGIPGKKLEHKPWEARWSK